jgi:hypothetical protein
MENFGPPLGIVARPPEVSRAPARANFVHCLVQGLDGPWIHSVSSGFPMRLREGEIIDHESFHYVLRTEYFDHIRDGGIETTGLDSMQGECAQNHRAGGSLSA